MRKTICCATVVTALAGGFAALYAANAAQPAKPMDDPHHAAAAMSEPAAGGEATATRRMIAYQLGEAQKHLLALAEVTPAEKYSWRPATGVRSTGEVFMHVASANYYLPTMWGATAAAGVNPQTLEKDGADKAKTMAALKASFDYVTQAMAALPDADLHKPVQIFGHTATVADLFMGITTHAHEHLGQSIAYARMNGITPPWTEEQQKQMKQGAKSGAGR
jgi:uncharacterized damage-inducible protein DinB